MSMESENKVLERIRKRSRLYYRLQITWFIIHYAAGLTAILAGAFASLSASSEVPEFIQANTWLWGLLATVLAGVVTFLGPLQKARDYKTAYYELFAAIQKFELQLMDLSALLEVLERAQERVIKLRQR